MPTSVFVAFLLLCGIYALVVVPIFMLAPHAGFLSAVVSLGLLCLALAAQACMATGGCKVVPWVFVILYFLTLIGMLFVAAVVLTSRFQWGTKLRHSGIFNDGNNGVVLLDSDSTPEDEAKAEEDEEDAGGDGSNADDSSSSSSSSAPRGYRTLFQDRQKELQRKLMAEKERRNLV